LPLFYLWDAGFAALGARTIGIFKIYDTDGQRRVSIRILMPERWQENELCLYFSNLFRSACTDGYLKLYLKGQEATDSYDKFDYEMCGNKSNPNHVVSDGPRLVMVFSSGELQATGFKAK